MVKITSGKELEDWLKDKPADWALVISARIAMRSLVFALSDSDLIKNNNHVLSLFRAIAVSWASHSMPTYDMSYAADIASDKTADYNAGTYCICLASAVASLNIVSEKNIYSEYAAEIAGECAQIAHDADTDSYNSNPNSIINQGIWRAIENDLNWLREHNHSASTRQLSRYRLWLKNKTPRHILKLWDEIKPKLIFLDLNNELWINWYERRLIGERAAFNIPYDRRRIEDKRILKTIFDNEGQDFWNIDASSINRQLSILIDEARERCQERYDQEQRDKEAATETLESELAPIIPAQNTNALTFQRGETGKIAVNQTASSDEILKDADSVERHQLTLEDALEIRRKCETSNAGARLTQLLENYLNSIGQSLEEIKPSMAVQRGEKLRQELAAYDNTDNMLAPISDEILLDLKSWQSAHNMMVGLQPKLNALDTSMLGPDRQPELFPPDELRKLASDADEANMFEDGEVEIVHETANLAPEIPNPNDRLTIWSVKTAQNLVIEIAATAASSPLKTTIGGGIAIAAVTNPAISIPIGLTAAIFLINRREWVFQKMGNTPTWKSIFEQLCNKYDEIESFNRNKKSED